MKILRKFWRIIFQIFLFLFGAILILLDIVRSYIKEFFYNNRLAVLLFDWKKRQNMDSLYRKKGDPWGSLERQDQISAATSLVNDRRYANCLDVGTALGAMAAVASEFCDKVIAIDISNEAVKRAKARLKYYKNIQILRKNIRIWKPEEKFDLIILGDVLYYLGDKLFEKEFDKLIKKIAEMLNKNGQILITHSLNAERFNLYVQNKYLYAFKNNGIVVEKENKFTDGENDWLHYALKKLSTI